jgi:hypothetical protein
MTHGGTPLHLIEQALIEQNKTMVQYHLPSPIHDWNRNGINPLIGQELNYDAATEWTLRGEAYVKLNEDQRRSFDIIIAAVEQNPESAHFLQGYTGTGETFPYTAICHHFRAQEKVVLLRCFIRYRRPTTSRRDYITLLQYNFNCD